MLALAQKEPILNAIIKICIEIHKNLFFFNQSGSNLTRWYISKKPVKFEVNRLRGEAHVNDQK